MMCQIDRESWKKFLRDQTRGQLYDLWFEEIIATSSESGTVLTDDLINETRAKLGSIARLMLESRCDLVSKAALDADQVPLARLRTSDTRPFGIFVEEAKDEWGFVHGSFREFTLAKTIEAELKNVVKYDLIARYDQFDCRTSGVPAGTLPRCGGTLGKLRAGHLCDQALPRGLGQGLVERLRDDWQRRRRFGGEVH
jgi:hypothetical protein